MHSAPEIVEVVEALLAASVGALEGDVLAAGILALVLLAAAAAAGFCRPRPPRSGSSEITATSSSPICSSSSSPSSCARIKQTTRRTHFVRIGSTAVKGEHGAQVFTDLVLIASVICV